MGSKNKLKRFNENKTFHNVVEPTRDEVLHNTLGYKGKWKDNFFKNQNPIVLELGCGKGEYTIGLATQYLDKNFIGICLSWKSRNKNRFMSKKVNTICFIYDKLVTSLQLDNHLFYELAMSLLCI